MNNYMQNVIKCPNCNKYIHMYLIESHYNTCLVNMPIF